MLVFGSTVPQNHQYRRGCAVNQQASIDKLNETDTAWVTFSNMNARANMKAICVKGKFKEWFVCKLFNLLTHNISTIVHACYL